MINQDEKQRLCNNAVLDFMSKSTNVHNALSLEIKKVKREIDSLTTLSVVLSMAVIILLIIDLLQ